MIGSRLTAMRGFYFETNGSKFVKRWDCDLGLMLCANKKKLELVSIRLINSLFLFLILSGYTTCWGFGGFDSRRASNEFL